MAKLPGLAEAWYQRRAPNVRVEVFGDFALVSCVECGKVEAVGRLDETCIDPILQYKCELHNACKVPAENFEKVGEKLDQVRVRES